MAECLYLSAKDIQTILGIGRRQSYEILHYFDERGEMFRFGKTIRVRKTYFDAWLNRVDGAEKRKKTLDAQFQRVRAAK